MEVRRLLTNLCTEDLVASKTFYTSLFDFDVGFDSDWFVHLSSRDGGFEIGLILKGHDIVPQSVAAAPGGMYLTFVVDDVSVVHSKADELGLNIEQAPASTPYGQKRMLLVSPEGVTIDVSSPETPSVD